MHISAKPVWTAAFLCISRLSLRVTTQRVFFWCCRRPLQQTSFASFCPCSDVMGFSFMSFSLEMVLGSSRRSIWNRQVPLNTTVECPGSHVVMLENVVLFEGFATANCTAGSESAFSNSHDEPHFLLLCKAVSQPTVTFLNQIWSTAASRTPFY